MLHESVCEMLSPRGTSALDRGQSAKSPARQFRKFCYYYIDPFSLMQILRIHPFKFSSKIDAASISLFLCLLSSAVERRTIEGRRPGGTRSPQSGDGTRLHSLGESSAGRGVPPREVGTARRVRGAAQPRRRAKARRRRARGRTEGRDARGSVGAPQGAEIAPGRRLRRRSPRTYPSRNLRIRRLRLRPSKEARYNERGRHGR